MKKEDRASKYDFSDFKRIVDALDKSPDSYTPEKILEAYEDSFKVLDSLQSIFYFIHDFVHFRYLYVSKSFKNIMGVDPDFLKQGGFAAGVEYFHPDDRQGVGRVHEEIFKYLYNQPIEERNRFRFDFNYRFRNGKGDYRNILQQSMFIVFVDGKPVYDFSTCTDITLQNKRHKLELMVQKLNDDEVFETVHYFTVDDDNTFDLSKTEMEILRYAAKGYSSKEIADTVSRSLHTINNHRKNILAKTKCKSLHEAILKMGFIEQI